MRLFHILFRPYHFLVAVISSLLMGGIYVYSQVLGNLSLVGVWVATIPILHAFLLVVFLLLFGASMAYQIHLWKSPKVCSLSQRAKGGGLSGAGTLGIFLVAQCPACASLGALFLPLSTLTIIGEYTIWLNAASILLVLFTLHYLGAFRPE